MLKAADADETNLSMLPVLKSNEEQRQLPIVGLRAVAEITTAQERGCRACKHAKAVT
jgi:hypothetical protein